MLLEVKDLNTYYGTSHVLQGISLTVDQGEIVALLGRNGMGKSTALKSIMGLVKPLVFGYIVAAVGCYQGLATKGGTQGVGLSTTRSVVMSSVLILASDYFLNLLILRFVYP